MVTEFLKEKFGAPRKLKKVFCLDEKQREKRLEFCKQMIEKQIKGEDIFFTDETGIDLNPFSYDYIRLYPEELKKLREGDPELCELVNRQVKKFEKGIMVAGGISYYGLSDLMLMKGTMNDFQYSQALFDCKENIEKFNKKYNCNLIFDKMGLLPI